MMGDDEREAIEALGWQTINTYGYTHPTGWSIGRYRVSNEWITVLWDAREIHKRFSSPFAAAQYHAELVRHATALD